jgi:hypothetical protein
MDPHEIIAKLGMFWPMGDPGQLRQARAAYRQCASDIGTVQAACQSTGNQVQASNQGPPIDGFAAWLAKWQTDPGYFPAAISACNQLADACDAYAQRIEDSHHRIIELATAAAVTLGIGLALTFFTFGASDATAVAAAAAWVAATFAEGSALVTAVAEIVLVIGVGALEGVAFDGTVQVEACYGFHDQKSFNWDELGQSAGFGALTGGLGFGAGSLTARVGSRLLPGLLDASPAAGRTLNALGKIPGPVRGGLTGTVAGGGLAAGFDQLTTGHVNPQDVLIGALSGGAGGAIGGAGRRTPKPATGAGGSWPVINERPSPDVVQQTDPMSCVAACGEMLSNGAIDQATLVHQIGKPSDPAMLAHQLGQDWQGGYVAPSAFDQLLQRGSWGAELRTPDSGPVSHMVVVDGLDGAGNVTIRDPQDGTRYEMTRDDFLQHWTGRVVFH